MDDSIGAGKRHHFRREGGRAVFGDETKEICEGEETFCLVELAHAEFDMWRKVEGAEEADFVAVGLEHFADLEGEHATVAVACYGVRAVRLLRFDGGVIGRDCFFDGGEVGLARVEAAGAKGVDGAVGEVFGQIDEDKDFTDAGMYEPEGVSSAGVLESDDGIVVVWMVEVFEGISERADCWVSHYGYDGCLSGMIETLLDCESCSDKIDGSDSHFESGGFHFELILR